MPWQWITLGRSGSQASGSQWGSSLLLGPWSRPHTRFRTSSPLGQARAFLGACRSQYCLHRHLYTKNQVVLDRRPAPSPATSSTLHLDGLHFLWLYLGNQAIQFCLDFLPAPIPSCSHGYPSSPNLLQQWCVCGFPWLSLAHQLYRHSRLGWVQFFNFFAVLDCWSRPCGPTGSVVQAE